MDSKSKTKEQFTGFPKKYSYKANLQISVFGKWIVHQIIFPGIAADLVISLKLVKLAPFGAAWF